MRAVWPFVSLGLAVVTIVLFVYMLSLADQVPPEGVVVREYDAPLSDTIVAHCTVSASSIEVSEGTVEPAVGQWATESCVAREKP